MPKSSEQICAELAVDARFHQPMRRLTSLRTGGEIACVAFPDTPEKAARLVQMLDANGIRWSPLGYGTNLLVADGTLDRVAVSLRALKTPVTFDGLRVRVPAGYSLPRLVNQCADRGLSGIEGLAPIPGSLGGAVKMNAGSHGYEIADVIESVDIVRDGRILTLPRDEIAFAYRHSPFTAQDLILGTTLRLRPGNPEASRAEIAEYRRHRAATQPVNANSAGCMFKNPATGPTTGRMIDELGLKGKSIGGATISPLHANFIVTDGAARAADVFALIEHIRSQVRKTHGIELEMEVEVWD
ncbi:MAG: UDP-N-acetylmuramate dehydrogenase [Chloracidobacterium sp.]|uniref:UDP-N-acetylenolpyruvoylglucosamine reductase n=1 Tax=Chloracidobacterium validum TaxID=2821543 RepID=A0ABX8B9C0_9BACT|nr:UDP-N-acetylmuramate dehydrogenase [Chloracidobacterium validum]QUW03534.1 UDP-N-acetylmuramate dehydrogenase [Chloracidobacterium validum]